MNDSSTTSPQPASTIPPDDPQRNLAIARPNEDQNLPHLAGSPPLGVGLLWGSSPPQAASTIPPDDPQRNLAIARPNEDQNLPHIGGSSLFGVGCVRATGAMPAELDPLARPRFRPTGGVAPTSSFMVLVFL